MKLGQIHIEHFKSIKDLVVPFGQVTELSGRNGSGKSSVYDAFLWCLFGRDSLGQAQFDVEPRNTFGVVQGGIPTVELSIDGHMLKRELHDKAPKARFMVDGVTKSMLEYKSFVAGMIDEGTFKTLTDVHAVCQMHWTERRKLLLTLAGDIPGPQGFDSLLAELNGRDMKEFKDLHQKERLRVVKERDSIEPRIDELERGLVELDRGDGSAVAERERLTGELETLKSARTGLLHDEQSRNEILAQVQGLRTKQVEREAFLRNDTSRVTALIQEKAKIQQADQTWQSEQGERIFCAAEKERLLSNQRQSIEDSQSELEQCRVKYKAEAVPIEYNLNHTGDCPTCGQPLPQDRMDEIIKTAKQRHQNDVREQQQELQVITSRGNCLQDRITETQVVIEKLEGEIAALNNEIEAEIGKREAWQNENVIRLAQIDKEISEDVKVAPENDQEWLDMQVDIEALAVGESVAEQINIIENQCSELNMELVKVNQVLAQADRTVQDKARIEELEALEQEHIKKILEIDKRLKRIDEYVAKESADIEKAVNGMFKHVKWSLFNRLKNEKVEPCCTPMLNGVQYSNLSYGERILVGLDIATVLAAHYGVVVPLFVDNAESYTPEIEWPGQVVRLVHKKSQKALKIS